MAGNCAALAKSRSKTEGLTYSETTGDRRRCDRHVYGRLTGGLDQSSGYLFNLGGHMIDMVELPRQPIVQHRKPCCVIGGASLSAVQGQRFEEHGDCSSLYEGDLYDISSRFAIPSKGERPIHLVRTRIYPHRVTSIAVRDEHPRQSKIRFDLTG
jgi:hypothetical protein